MTGRARTGDTPRQRATCHRLSGYGEEVTTHTDDAAIAAAKTKAQAAMERIAKAERDADAGREERNAAIHEMHEAGRSIPDIGRDLDIPVSTVRQAIRMAIVRAAS